MARTHGEAIQANEIDAGAIQANETEAHAHARNEESSWQTGERFGKK
jgi:hypothetical protein